MLRKYFVEPLVLSGTPPWFDARGVAGYYYLGSIIPDAPSMDFQVFRGLLDPIAQESYFWEALAEFMKLGKDLLLRWTIAAVALAVVSGLLGYAVTYRIQTARSRQRASKMGIEYARFLKEMEEKGDGE